MWQSRGENLPVQIRLGLSRHQDQAKAWVGENLNALSPLSDYLWHWNTELFLCTRQRGMTISNWFLPWWDVQLVIISNFSKISFELSWRINSDGGKNKREIQRIDVNLKLPVRKKLNAWNASAVGRALLYTFFSQHSWLSSPVAAEDLGVSLAPGWWWLMVLQISVWSPPPPIQADTHAWTKLWRNNWIK